jgi:hypothetical protein
MLRLDKYLYDDQTILMSPSNGFHEPSTADTVDIVSGSWWIVGGRMSGGEQRVMDCWILAFVHTECPQVRWHNCLYLLKQLKVLQSRSCYPLDYQWDPEIDGRMCYAGNVEWSSKSRMWLHDHQCPRFSKSAEISSLRLSHSQTKNTFSLLQNIRQ